MPCFHPLNGFLHMSGRGISFNPRTGYTDRPMVVPCGRCIGCRLERSRQWALRCMHEAQLHQANCFLTLTYDDENLPPDMSLNKKHVQDFLKRLRKSIAPRRISFFHCGEYGDTTLRPHYHMLVFGYDFPDKTVYKRTPDGGTLWKSSTLDGLWKFGFCVIGPLNFETAAYTARYSLKKITGEKAEAHYQGRLPEYVTMSLKPAIGRGWFNRYQDDTYPSDTVVARGIEGKPPAYYDKLLKKADQQLHSQIKRERELKAQEPHNRINTTPERLAVRETVTKARLSLRSRDST